MGAEIEINDTLSLSAEQGFPVDVLNLERHQKDPITLDDVKDKIFTFTGKGGARIYQRPPARVFLVQQVDGKWLWWGHAAIIEQTISQQGDSADSFVTSGSYKVTLIYDPAYQEICTRWESPPGMSYFSGGVES